MYNPMPCGFLPDPFLHQRLFRAEEFHGELVVCWLEEGLQLIAKEPRFAVRRWWSWFHRRAVQGNIVQPAEVDFARAAALLQRHVGVACNKKKIFGNFPPLFFVIQ